MRIKLFIILCFWSLSPLSHTFCQTPLTELLSNNGFENGFPAPSISGAIVNAFQWETDSRNQGGSDVVPSGHDVVDYLGEPCGTWWSRVFGSHAADWYGHNFFELHEMDNGNVFQRIDANNGVGFAGMRRGQLMQQKLNNRIELNKSYKMSMYIRLPKNNIARKNVSANCLGNSQFLGGVIDGNKDIDFQNAKLNIYMMSSDIRYDTYWLGKCDDDYTKKEGADRIHLAHSTDISLEAYPAGEWHKLEFFITPNYDPYFNNDNNSQFDGIRVFSINPNDQTPNTVFDWIAIELDHDNTVCESPYILIDDVSIVENTCNECSNCTNKDGCINITVQHHPTSLPDPISAGINWVEISGLTNVTLMKVRVEDLDDNLFYSFTIRNPPPILKWNQLDYRNASSFTGNYPPLNHGDYTLEIEAFNDCTRFHSEFDILVDGNDYSGIVDYNNMDENEFILPHNYYCGDLLKIQNKVFSQNTDYVAGRVEIGPSVTINPNVTVTIQAEEYIDISNGFTVEAQGVFEAYIEPCDQDELTISGSLIRKDIVDKLDNEKILKREKEDNSIVNIFPNPATDKLNVQLKDFEFENLEIHIYNSVGQLLYQSLNGQTNNIEIDISSFASGSYYISFSSKEKAYTKKFIKL